MIKHRVVQILEYSKLSGWYYIHMHSSSIRARSVMWPERLVLDRYVRYSNPGTMCAWQILCERYTCIAIAYCAIIQWIYYLGEFRRRFYISGWYLRIPLSDEVLLTPHSSRTCQHLANLIFNTLTTSLYKDIFIFLQMTQY